MVELNSYNPGDTEYVEKLNEDFSAIQAALNLAVSELDAIKAAGQPGADIDFRLNSQNLLINGGFDYWQRGDDARPDAWEIENDSSFEIEKSTEVSINTYSVKTTNQGTLSQLLSDEQFKGTVSPWGFSFSVRVKTSTADIARIGVYDGVTTQWSNYHTGDGEWQVLSVKFSKGSAPSQIKFVMVNNGGEVYWNAGSVIRGTTSATLFISNDPTTEELRVLSLLEKGIENFHGVGALNDATGAREITKRIRFISPKRGVPVVTISDIPTGFDYDVHDIDRQGFSLTIMDLVDSTGTDGFEIPIEWEAEA